MTFLTTDPYFVSMRSGICLAMRPYYGRHRGITDKAQAPETTGRLYLNEFECPNKTTKLR